MSYWLNGRPSKLLTASHSTPGIYRALASVREVSNEQYRESPCKYVIIKSAKTHIGPDVDLCLLGKIGNGKSALGNSLVQRNAFASEPTASSVTKDVSIEVAEINGRRIKVVDGPGVGDTDSAETVENSFPDVLAGFISINPTGYHAFLLVVKFGGRFTKEDRDSVEYLKNVFGRDFVRRYCILVMTYGDQFEQQVNVGFHEWIDAQTGILAQLVKECDHRVILFDNKTADETKKEKQISHLIEMVDRLMQANCRYTNEQFELARSVREAFILSSKKTIIVEETMIEANIILQNFKVAQEKLKTDNDTTSLEQLLLRAESLYEELVKKDNKSCVLRDSIVHVHSIRTSIREEVNVCRRMSQCREQLQKENEKILKKDLQRQSVKLNQKLDKNRRQIEQKTKEFVCQLEAKFEKEKLEYHAELQKIQKRTVALEEENKALKKKDRDMFTAIKHKVIKTFSKQKND